MIEAYTSPESTLIPALADADSHSSQLFHAIVNLHETLQEAHDRPARQLQVILRLGQMLPSSGVSTYRVKAPVATLAHAAGISEYRAQVTYTEIIATSYMSRTSRTGLVKQRTMGVNVGRIDCLNNLATSLKGRTIFAENVTRFLDKIEKAKPLHD